MLWDGRLLKANICVKVVLSDVVRALFCTPPPAGQNAASRRAECPHQHFSWWLDENRELSSKRRFRKATSEAAKDNIRVRCSFILLFERPSPESRSLNQLTTDCLHLKDGKEERMARIVFLPIQPIESTFFNRVVTRMHGAF
jgi:hypothetical protein